MNERESSTAILLEELHKVVPIKKTDRKSDTTGKAQNAADYKHFFQELAFLYRNQVATEVIPDEQLRSLEDIVLQAPSRRDMIEGLRIQTHNLLEPMYTEYMRAMFSEENIKKEGIKRMRDFLENNRRRIKKTRNTFVSGVTNRLQEAHLTLQAVMQFGISNVAVQSWSLFEVIPDVVKQEQETHGNGKKYSAEDFHEIAAVSTQSLIIDLVHCHDEIFNIVINHMRRPRVETDPSWSSTWANREMQFHKQPFHPDDFRLEGKKLELKAEFISYIRQGIEVLFREGELDISEPRVGCAGINLIPPIHGWCLKAAKECLFPHAEHIQSLPYDSPLVSDFTASNWNHPYVKDSDPSTVLPSYRRVRGIWTPDLRENVESKSLIL